MKRKVDNPVGSIARNAVASDVANKGGHGAMWKPGKPRDFQPVFNFSGVHANRNGVKRGCC